MKTAYAVILIGQGDTEIKIVSKEVWDWINSGMSGRAEVPQEVIDNASRQTDWEFGGSSPMNDKALCACSVKADNKYNSYSPDRLEFSSLKEFADYCREQDVEIVDTYEGVIY